MIISRGNSFSQNNKYYAVRDENPTLQYDLIGLDNKAETKNYQTKPEDRKGDDTDFFKLGDIINCKDIVGRIVKIDRERNTLTVINSKDKTKHELDASSCQKAKIEEKQNKYIVNYKEFVSNLK